MSGLVGPNGQPIDEYMAFKNKKATPPKLGPAFGSWAGRDLQYASLPGGGIVQFDLSKLTLSDFRSMKENYQINASLAVLSFLQHQAEWHIECEDKKIATFCEEQLRNNWTQLNRTLSTANWSGFSPGALEFENNLDTRSIDLTKIKDLIPEECRVHWDYKEGWAPPNQTKPKFKIFGGIKQEGIAWPIPKSNSFWFSLLMENGDHYGRKLLKPAFQSWFFSILVHLFANRYYERFGEPVPIGRAPFDEEVDIDGKSVKGNEFMLNMLQQLRSRSVVVLPNDRTQDSTTGKPTFDYSLEYLESQMRGADFERYMTRLDEEMSIALFTPILLLRTADVGSYNLGVGHFQIYQLMLNAMNDDRAMYIDKYLLRKMVNYNFSEKAPSAKIKFRKLGNTNVEMIKELLIKLVDKDKISVDLKELGEISGMTLTEIKQTIAEPPAPDSNTDPAPDPASNVAFPFQTDLQAVVTEIIARVKPQVESAFRTNTFNAATQINMGFKRKFEKALEDNGVPYPVATASEVYGRLDRWVDDSVKLGQENYEGPEGWMSMFTKVLKSEVKRLDG